MRLKVVFAGVSIALLSACNSAENKSTATQTAPAKTIPAPTSDLSAKGQAAVLDMLKPYYELKEALVATNAAKADAAASRLLSTVEDTRHQLEANDATKRGAIDTLADVMKSTESLINTKDETCGKKRAAFEQISNGLFSVLAGVHMKHAGVYHDYCPMAFDNKGAYWLSDIEDIRNPYFGKKMMECGEVRDSL